MMVVDSGVQTIVIVLTLLSAVLILATIPLGKHNRM